MIIIAMVKSAIVLHHHQHQQHLVHLDLQHHHLLCMYSTAGIKFRAISEGGGSQGVPLPSI